MPGPTLVGSGTFVSTATAGATLTPDLPAGWAADDVHVLLAARKDAGTMTALAGWTQYASLTGTNGTSLRTEVWWRRAVAGDAAPTITFGTGTVLRCARVLGVRGCPTGSDPLAAGSRRANGNTTTVSTTDISPAAAPTLGLFCFTTASGPTSALQPSGWSAFTVHRSANLGIASGYATRDFAGAGAYGAPTTTTGQGGVNDGLLLALLGAAGPATQRWDGSAWQPATVKRWDGSAWVTATVKRWDGAGWV